MRPRRDGLHTEAAFLFLCHATYQMVAWTFLPTLEAAHRTTETCLVVQSALTAITLSILMDLQRSESDNVKSSTTERRANVEYETLPGSAAASQLDKYCNLFEQACKMSAVDCSAWAISFVAWKEIVLSHRRHIPRTSNSIMLSCINLSNVFVFFRLCWSKHIAQTGILGNRRARKESNCCVHRNMS